MKKDTKNCNNILSPYVQHNELTRRRFILIGSIAALSSISACTPAKILFKKYPQKYKRDEALIEGTLRALVVTIIPGADYFDKDLIKVFYDGYYPLSKYRNFIVYDISNRSKKLYGIDQFDALESDQRNTVVENAQVDSKIIRKLYNGAIILSQVAYYAGIYDDDKGCNLIDFEGKNYGYTHLQKCYEDNMPFLAKEHSSGGNFE